MIAQAGRRAGERHRVPEKSFRVLCRQSTEVDRFKLMAAEYATTATTRMARLLEVSTSGYYKRVKRSRTTELSDREQRKADLAVKIIDHHRESGGVSGSPPDHRRPASRR